MMLCIMCRPRLLGKTNLILLTIRCMMKCLYYVLTIIWTHHFSFIFNRLLFETNVGFYKMFHIIHFINLLFQNENIVVIQNTKLLLCKLFKMGQKLRKSIFTILLKEIAMTSNSFHLLFKLWYEKHFFVI